MLSRLFGDHSPHPINRGSRPSSPLGPRCRPFLENLEDRLTPASTAAVVTFNGAPSLFITGDNAEDNLVVTEDTVAGSFSVVGSGLNNSYTGITNIFVNLFGGANQSVTYIGSPGGALAGRFGVSESSTTTFTLTIDNDASITGLVQYDPNSVAAVAVNLGLSGGATTTIGNVIIYEGPGGVTVNVDDITMGFLSANFATNQACEVNIGDNGSAALTMDFLSVVNKGIGDLVVDIFENTNAGTINGNVYVICGRDGSFELEDATVNGYVSFNAPNAVNAVDVEIDQTAGATTITGFLSIVTGAGNDAVIDIEFTTIGQNFALVTGAGNDDADFINISVAGTASADFGTGDDVFQPEDNVDGISSVFNGTVNFQMGDGADTLDYGIVGNDAAKFISGGVSNGGPPLTDTSQSKAVSDAISPVPISEVNFEIFA